MKQESQLAAETMQDDDAGFDIVDLASQLLARKWLLAGVTVAGMGGGWFTGQLPPDEFRATAVAQIDRQTSVQNLPPELIGAASGEAGAGGPGLGAQFHVIRSPVVLGPVVDRLNLDWRIEPELFPVVGHMAQRRGLPFLGNSDLPRYARGGESAAIERLAVDDTLIGVAATLTVTGDGAFEARLPDGDPVAGRVGEDVRLADGFSFTLAALDAAPGRVFRLWRDSRRQAINRIRGGVGLNERGSTGVVDFSFSGTERGVAVAVVNALVEAHREYALARRAAQIDQSVDFIAEQLPAIRASLEDATRALAAFRAETQTVELTLGSRALLDQIVTIEAELEQVSFEKEQLAQRLTPNHPDFRALVARSSRLTERRDAIRQEIARLPDEEQALVRLTERVEWNRQLERQLVTRNEQLRIARAGTVSNVHVLEEAEGAGLTGPNRRRPMILAGLGGFFAAALLVLGRNALVRAVDNAGDLEAAGFPVYATIESVAGLRRGGPDAPYYAIVRADAAHPATESFRGLRTALQYGLAPAPSRSVMVSSSAPSVGKSFVALNLALVTAQAGKRVLLIDADMRRGRLRRQFPSAPRQGLAELLSGQAALDQVLHHAGGAEPFFIGRGRHAPNPVELLAGPRFGTTLAQLAEVFDMVIVDAPPLLAVADGRIVAQHVGLTLLVAQHTRTTIEELRAVQAELRLVEAPIDGIVINQFDVERSRYGRYGSRYAYYRSYKYAYS